MEVKRITEETVAGVLEDDAHVLVTQTEGGTADVRRVPRSVFVGALVDQARDDIDAAVQEAVQDIDVSSLVAVDTVENVIDAAEDVMEEE